MKAMLGLAVLLCVYLVSAVMAQLQTVKLLIVDELGYVLLSPTGAELLFEVLSQRYEGGSTIVISNLPF
ncbi:ATP-binding protein [Borborobacter arsenicus]|uniref:ATP-binding protein n=1 Tax=Borborobacter arsenicus TaxID=1851146 RepID=UPI0026CC6E0E